MKYYQCRKCQNTYEERESDKTSILPDKYLKAHLGFCGKKCWDKLSVSQKAHEKMILGLHWTIRKDNAYKV